MSDVGYPYTYSYTTLFRLGMMRGDATLSALALPRLDEPAPAENGLAARARRRASFVTKLAAVPFDRS